jgi:hypothetical protein
LIIIASKQTIILFSAISTIHFVLLFSGIINRVKRRICPNEYSY